MKCKSLFYICQVIFIWSSSKQAPQELTFEGLPYPSSQDGSVVAKAKQLALYPSNSGVNMRNEFSNLEANEGSWVIEAAGNYLDNQNLGQGAIMTQETYQIQVITFVQDNQFWFEGTDLSQKFDYILSNIIAIEGSSDSQAAIWDVDIIEVKNGLSTLEVRVAFVEAADEPSGFINFSSALHFVEDGINADAIGVFIVS
jgi:hypothetical protein